MSDSVACVEQRADRPDGERSGKWIEKLMLRVLSLTPGVYSVTLVVTDERIHWTVHPLGKLEG